MLPAFFSIMADYMADYFSPDLFDFTLVVDNELLNCSNELVKELKNHNIIKEEVPNKYKLTFGENFILSIDGMHKYEPVLLESYRNNKVKTFECDKDFLEEYKNCLLKKLRIKGK